jgi:t-SNARE complex subunit (syntaxin)
MTHMNMPRTHTEALRERAMLESLAADLAAAEALNARLQQELHVAHGDVVTLQAEMAYVASRHHEAVEEMRKAQDLRWLCPLAALAVTSTLVVIIGWLTQ